MSREMVCLQSGVDKPEACSRKEKVKHVPEVRDCGYLISHIAENLFFLDRKSTRLNSSHSGESRMPSSA